MRRWIPCKAYGNTEGRLGPLGLPGNAEIAPLAPRLSGHEPQGRLELATFCMPIIPLSTLLNQGFLSRRDVSEFHQNGSRNG